MKTCNNYWCDNILVGGDTLCEACQEEQWRLETETKSDTYERELALADIGYEAKREVEDESHR